MRIKKVLQVAAVSAALLGVAASNVGAAGASIDGAASPQGAGAVAQADPDPFGEFTSLTPKRILDTRTGLGSGGHPHPLGQGASIGVQITGQGGVPATGVQAVVVNATVVDPTGTSFLTVWPSGLARPQISNINYVPGQTVPNLVTVLLGADGKVNVYNALGSAHVVFDVVGYYSDETGPLGARYRSLSPKRLFDTRTGAGGVGTTGIGSGATLPFTVTGKGGVPATGVTAVVMNVTAAAPTAPGYLTVYPGDVSRPVASNLNFKPGVVVPNLVTVRVPDTGVVNFFNSLGRTHVFADVVGYYTVDTSTEEGRFVALPPTRSFDTRRDLGFRFGPDEVWSIGIAGFDYIPPSGAGAVLSNVTVTQPSDPAWLTVYPMDGCDTPPNASNLNFSRGQTIANLTVTRLAYDGCDWVPWPGSVMVHNPHGYTHVIIDTFGAFTDASMTPAVVEEMATSAAAAGAPTSRTAPPPAGPRAQRLDVTG